MVEQILAAGHRSVMENWAPIESSLRTPPVTSWHSWIVSHVSSRLTTWRPAFTEDAAGSTPTAVIVVIIVIIIFSNCCARRCFFD